MMTMRTCACVVALLSLGQASATSVSPVQKVLTMLDDMLTKGKKEKAEEAVRFSTYKQFCQSTSAEKTRNIADGKDAIVQLKADISKAASDITALTGEISTIGADLDQWGSEKAEANSLRAKEHADFEVVHADYSNAMDAVERAINTLRSSPGQSLAQVRESLLQVDSLQQVSAKAKQAIMSFLQGHPADQSEALLEDSIMSGQPQGNVKTYESSSGGIIDMVEKLGDKFKAERYELEKAEAVKQHGHDMIVQGLTDNIERGDKQMDEKTATKAQTEKNKAEAEGDLADTTASVAADTKFLSDLTSECNQKASDFETRQELRAGEIEAISKALEIMSGAAVGGGTQHLPSLVQKDLSLAQLRSNGQSPLQHQVARFLKERAQRVNSRILSLVAVKVEEDPFTKIKKMIQDMVTKLMEEANEEAEHKGFCDTELGTNKNTRDTKSGQVDSLTALIEELTASIAKLGQEAAELSDAIAASDAAVSKATAERSAERAKNTATIADAQVASEATARALAVLKTFYEGASGSTALIMFGSKVPGSPETFDKPYTGQQGSSTGVVGMLEVIQSDFTRLETETTAAEDAAAKAYETFTTDAAKDKAVKSTDVKHKLNMKTQKESDLENAKKDLKGTQEELDAATEYWEKLKPSCVEQVESYEERVAKRKEEIESLTDALKILSGEA